MPLARKELNQYHMVKRQACQNFIALIRLAPIVKLDYSNLKENILNLMVAELDYVLRTARQDNSDVITIFRLFLFISFTKIYIIYINYEHTTARQSMPSLDVILQEKVNHKI